jgi:hypothetical protein
MDPYVPRPSPGPASRSDSEHSLSHRISSFSDIRDYETYEGYQPDTQSQPLRGRHSLVSPQSPSPYDVIQSPQSYEGGYVSQPASRSSSWSNPFSGQNAAGGTGAGYEPVAASGAPSRAVRTYSSRRSSNVKPHHTIMEEPERQWSQDYSRAVSTGDTSHRTIREEPETIRESIDMATLVSHAAPIAGGQNVYSPLPAEDRDDPPVGFDVTGFMGPTTSQDAQFMKNLQHQEASGQLTGGLGMGLSVDRTVKEADLLAASPIEPRGGLSRTFSRRPSLSRQATVRARALAQEEANRRGEIVEVIVEEPEQLETGVDLSHVVGPSSVASPGPGGMRRTTLPMQQQQRQKSYLLFPQPDWKPFSMGWPYMLFLIVLSLGLGGMQEILYQVSTHQHLLEFRSPSEIPGFQYFLFKFAPTLISVTFGVLWQITDFDVRRLEAFHQLSREQGALASDSINVDYVTNFSFFRPFQAIYCRHYAVAISSITSLMAVSLVPTLSTASIQLNPDRAAREATPEALKFISINPVWSRFLTVVLFIIAALGCVLFWQLQRRRSGLIGDVKGIAGLAGMAVVSHVLMDFKDMDVATHKDIHAKLDNRRYVLRNCSLAPDDDPLSHSAEDHDRRKVNNLSLNPHPIMLRGRGGISFIVGIAAFAGLLPVFLFTDANVITDKAAWVVTALAICIKLSWGALDTTVRMMEPYFLLSRRHAPPKTLTLDYTAMPFGWVAVQAALNRHWLVASVGFGTIMTELLTVLVTSLATVEGRGFLNSGPPADAGRAANATAPGAPEHSDAGQETASSFWVSLGLVSFILVYMGVLALVVFLRRRRPFLPRQPNTIASVLAFIHQSKMLYDFVGTSKTTNAEMVAKLEGLGKKYGLGWFEGRDGQTHCGVDQEELMSSFKLGYDYSRSNKPWMERPVEWL